MSKQLGKNGALAFGIILAISSMLGDVRPASGITLPILSRPVLKSFFQSGDKPTQSQFAALIDSNINFVDDRKLLGLKVYDPQLTYDIGDTVIYNRLAPGSMVGQVEQGNSGTPPQMEFGGLTGMVPNDPIHSDVAQHFSGAYGFLGIKLEAPNGDVNYGYIQMGMDLPSGLPDDPPAIHVEYIVYNSEANAPLEVVPVPEPTCVLLGVGALLMLRRRSTR